jgi:hypothetical protein
MEGEKKGSQESFLSFFVLESWGVGLPWSGPGVPETKGGCREGRLPTTW